MRFFALFSTLLLMAAYGSNCVAANPPTPDELFPDQTRAAKAAAIEQGLRMMQMNAAPVSEATAKMGWADPAQANETAKYRDLQFLQKRIEALELRIQKLESSKTK